MVIQASGLTKRFGKLVAVDGIDFVVRRGECFGLLGPNGAGKTTTVRMIQAVSPPDGGSLAVLGRDVVRQGPEVRALVGVAHQDDNLDPDFTVERNLLIFARYFGIPAEDARRRAAELLRFMDLDERRKASVETLSGGLRRRLMLARALINAPEILILDEPTTGLDPQARHQLWRRVRGLREQGVTIVLTTHNMEEAARLCDRLVILDHGRILVEGAPERLVQEHAGREVVEVEGAPPELDRFVDEHGWSSDRAGDRVLVFTGDGESVRGAILERFRPRNCALRMANLEDVFLRLTGHGLRDG